jgi:hypothetical protein
MTLVYAAIPNNLHTLDLDRGNAVNGADMLLRAACESGVNSGIRRISAAFVR